VDIEVILDAAQAGAPGLRELARRFLEAGSRHLGVPLDAASVMARRSEGMPEVHLTGPAGRLLEHLAATEPDPPNDGNAFMALARTGAQATVMRIETEAASQRGTHPLQLSRLPRDLGITPRESLPQLRGGPLPALVRLQRRSQGSPQRRHISIRTRRDRHAAQQTPSPAANHAPHASVSPHTRP